MDINTKSDVVVACYGVEVCVAKGVREEVGKKRAGPCHAVVFVKVVCGETVVLVSVVSPVVR